VDGSAGSNQTPTFEREKVDSMFPEAISFKTNTLLKVILSPLGAFFIGVVVTLVLRNWPSEGAAAWVQAVGSILAIFAAFMVANHAHNRQVQAAKRASQEAECRAAHLAECAAYEATRALFGQAYQKRDRMRLVQASHARLQESRRALRITLSKPLSNEIVSNIFKIQEELSEAIVMMEEWGPTGPDNAQIETLRTRAKTVQVFYKSIQQEYLDISAKAGVMATVRVGI